MAYIVILQVLVDTPDAESAKQSVAATAHALLQCSSNAVIVDGAITAVEPVCAELDDAIGNEAYVKGELTRDWLMFDPDRVTEQCEGYWNELCGWGWRCNAKRYSATQAKIISDRMRKHHPNAVMLMDSDATAQDN